MAPTSSSSNKSILELIELSESYTDVPEPRISFSNEESVVGVAADIPNSDSEFEFSSTMITLSTADELFYNGKLLPLEPMSRMAMVEEEIGVMRRARSSRNPPATPHFELTRKSSSYPPPGRSSSSKWKDLFGLKKQQQQQDKVERPTSFGTGKLLKMLVFSRGKNNQVTQMPSSLETSSSSSSSSSASASSGGSDARSGSTRRSQVSTKPGRAGGSRAATPPGSPLSPYARASARVSPVLHVPACIFGSSGDWSSLKSFRGESRRSVEVL